MTRKHSKLGQAGSGSQELGKAGAHFPQSFRAQGQKLNSRSPSGNSTKGLLAGEVGPNRSASKNTCSKSWDEGLTPWCHRDKLQTRSGLQKYHGQAFGWLSVRFRQFVIWSFKRPKGE